MFSPHGAMANTQKSVVNFNVGGKRYEVSRSVFESHSACMLAKIVSEQWQQDQESEIFIERDGTIFRYVLNYLRDGQVKMPISETKAALVTELEYYSVVYDVTKIDDSREQVAKLIPTYDDFVQKLQDQSDTAHDVYRINSIAIYCVHQFFLQHFFRDRSRATQEKTPLQGFSFGPPVPPQPMFGCNTTSNIKAIHAVDTGTTSLFGASKSPNDSDSAATKVVGHFSALRRFQNVEVITEAVNLQITALGLEIVSCQDHPSDVGEVSITFNIRQHEL
jgi:hypothetical protein